MYASRDKYSDTAKYVHLWQRKPRKVGPKEDYFWARKGEINPIEIGVHEFYLMLNQPLLPGQCRKIKSIKFE